MGLRNDYQNSKNILIFAIEGDGKELYSSEIKAGDFPDDVSVSVKGVNKLTFKVTLKVDGLGDSGIGLFNPTLTK
ncbi:NPCBM/NEW2 domain-containing protein [Paenibacillus sp. LjRoot56]